MSDQPSRTREQVLAELNDRRAQRERMPVSATASRAILEDVISRLCNELIDLSRPKEPQRG